VIEIAGSERFDRSDGGGIFFEDGGSDAELALAPESPLASEHFVKDRAERKDVAAAVEFLAFDLLGRHVLERADDGAVFGDGRTGGDVGEGYGAGGSDGRLREAEVEELGAGFGEHNVAGFQIAVDDAAAVSFVERVGDFGANSQNLLGGKRAFGETVSEALALDTFHDQEIIAVLRADVKKGTDIWMIQRGDGFGFPLEAELARGIGGKMCRENFDGNGPVEARVARAVDFPHTTRA
jgi:hypothetical protein